MLGETLAVKYRPISFDDVVEQNSVKIILQQQLKTKTFKHAYLFCGPAGDGKTTCARIFANEINKGQGNPIEMDAASNNSVDDVREIIQQAKTKSLDSEFKVFIIDECHSLSNTAWQAMLKLIEEPPAGSIFIFATTDPQKIPATILSRVQRYNFRRISQRGIVDRLIFILNSEGNNISYKDEALEYIAKIADGGMRNAITLLDKCLSYSLEITLPNVISALGTVEYDDMIDLTRYIINCDIKSVIGKIEEIYSVGKDIKQFMKQYTNFILDLEKYCCGCDWNYIQVPRIEKYEQVFHDWVKYDRLFNDLLRILVKLNSSIKWSSAPKPEIEAELVLLCTEVN